MQRPSTWFVLIVTILTGTCSNALAGSFDVKPGLWEMTSQIKSQGQLPIPQEQLDKLSAKQRAAIEKMEQNSKPRIKTYRSCLTKEKLAKDQAAFFSNEPGMKCESRLTSNTRTFIAGSRQCTNGSMEQTGDFKFNARDPEHVTGKINITIRDGARRMSSHGDLSGQWISASCGKAP